MQKLPIYFLTLHVHSFPTRTTIITQSTQFTLGFTLCVMYSVGLNKYELGYVYHYSGTQFISLPLKLLVLYLFKIFPTFGNHWSFTLTTVFPLPECHIVEITQLVAFLPSLLLLKNMQSFFHAFLWHSSFLYSAE